MNTVKNTEKKTTKRARLTIEVPTKIRGGAVCTSKCNTCQSRCTTCTCHRKVFKV